MASWPSRAGSARDIPLLHKAIDSVMVAMKVKARRSNTPALSTLFITGMECYKDDELIHKILSHEDDKRLTATWDNYSEMMDHPHLNKRS